ncbi:MAG TPA: hypothetical protein VGC42_10485, partial [Kofleriaceae bacterium]
ETLAPQTWTGTLVTGSPTTASIQTSGSDALGLHNWALSVASDTDKTQADIGGSYAYTGWRPGVRIAGARSLIDRSGYRVDGRNLTYTEEDWSGTLSLSVPFESRPGTSWTLSADYDVDWFRLVTPPRIMLDPNQRVPIKPATDYLQAGVGTRLAYSHIHSTTFGLGPQEGWDAAVSFRLDNPAFGATYKNVTLSYGLDVYQRLWGVSPTLFVRMVGSLRAGDLVRPGGFGLGGVPAQDVVMSIVDSTRFASSGYLRGYPQRVIIGNQYHLVNAEYRQELWTIEHGLATFPIYFRRLHLGLLSDTGAAFDGSFIPREDLRTSVGAALRLDTYFGAYVPGTFELGYSRGLQKGGIDETWFLLTGSL